MECLFLLSVSSQIEKLQGVACKTGRMDRECAHENALPFHVRLRLTWDGRAAFRDCEVQDIVILFEREAGGRVKRNFVERG